MNGVPVARHGLKLGEDETTAPPGHSCAHFRPQDGRKNQQSKQQHTFSLEMGDPPPHPSLHGVGGMGGALTMQTPKHTCVDDRLLQELTLAPQSHPRQAQIYRNTTHAAF